MHYAEDLSLLGEFLKTHGIDGHLILKLFLVKDDEPEEGEPVFVEIDGIPVPFFISEFRVISDYTALVKLDEVDNSFHASDYVNCRVFYHSSGADETLRKDKGNFDKFKGFRVVDRKHGYSGILEEVVECPENPVMKIDLKGKEILVPFHDDIITEIDYKKRVIKISAPEGLFDLYL